MLEQAWQINPHDIFFCSRRNGKLCKLGKGAFGTVRRGTHPCPLCVEYWPEAHRKSQPQRCSRKGTAGTLNLTWVKQKGAMSVCFGCLLRHLHIREGRGRGRGRGRGICSKRSNGRLQGARGTPECKGRGMGICVIQKPEKHEVSAGV